jgi:hypothetical protein
MAVAPNEIDVVAALGGVIAYSHRLGVYVPSADKHGNPIPQQPWIDAVVDVFIRYFGDATVLPPCTGYWRNPAGGDIKEEPRYVYAFVKPATLEAALVELRRVLHSMGKETDQGEVGIEIDNDFFTIGEFDEG